MRTRIEASGQGDKIKKPNRFNLTSILEGLNRPGYAANNLIREFTDPSGGITPGDFDPLKSLLEGFNFKRKPSGGDVMRDIGVENDKFQCGFALDVVNPWT